MVTAWNLQVADGKSDSNRLGREKGGESHERQLRQNDQLHAYLHH